MPGGFLWVQLSHALQYLPFPLRVDANRYAAVKPRTPLEKRRRTLLAYLGLVVAGAAILNGAVWKLRNEKVRKELFRHLDTRTA